MVVAARAAVGFTGLDRLIAAADSEILARGKDGVSESEPNSPNSSARSFERAPPDLQEEEGGDVLAVDSSRCQRKQHALLPSLPSPIPPARHDPHGVLPNSARASHLLGRARQDQSRQRRHENSTLLTHATRFIDDTCTWHKTGKRKARTGREDRDGSVGNVVRRVMVWDASARLPLVPDLRASGVTKLCRASRHSITTKLLSRHPSRPQQISSLSHPSALDPHRPRPSILLTPTRGRISHGR